MTLEIVKTASHHQAERLRQNRVLVSIVRDGLRVLRMRSRGMVPPRATLSPRKPRTGAA